jgi:hypothetical protein
LFDFNIGNNTFLDKTIDRNIFSKIDLFLSENLNSILNKIFSSLHLKKKLKSVSKPE